MPSANKVGSVGRVIDVAEIRIVPEPNAAPGTKEGLIWVKGGTVFSGYWNLPDATSKSLDKDGWFRISGVPAGDYDLAIQLYEPPGEGCLVSPVGSRVVSMPRGRVWSTLPQ